MPINKKEDRYIVFCLFSVEHIFISHVNID